jgi:hypothetical protein
VLYGEGLAALAELCLVVYCVLDVLRTPGRQMRYLPKPVWLLLCFVPPIVGPLAWLLLGRPQGPQQNLPYKGNAGRAPDSDQPGRPVAQNPDDDEAFMRGLRERAADQRRRAAEERGRAEDDQPS